MKSENIETQKGSELTSGLPASSQISSGEFDVFFDDFLSRRMPGLADWTFSTGLYRDFPKVDIIENDNEIEVQANLPGVKKEELDISINKQTITIRASTKADKIEEGKFFRCQISPGEFQSTFSLPVDIDNKRAKAEFNNGILKVTIPKTDKSKS